MDYVQLPQHLQGQMMAMRQHQQQAQQAQQQMQHPVQSGQPESTAHPYNGALPVQQHRPPMGRAPSMNDNHARPDYQMQLMLLEQQNKKRLLMQRWEEERLQSQGRAGAEDNVPPRISPYGSERRSSDEQGLAASRTSISLHHTLQDHQMQLMLLEQQNRKLLLMARQEQDSLQYPAGVGPDSNAPGISPPSSGRRSIDEQGLAASQTSTSRIHALQDRQMQLMLLEQQNKKRLLMARQEQESLGFPASDGTDDSVSLGMSTPPSLGGRPSPIPDEMREEGGSSLSNDRVPERDS
jgi:hypothetical protein